jgi:hypothetical protein
MRALFVSLATVLLLGFAITAAQAGIITGGGAAPSAAPATQDQGTARPITQWTMNGGSSFTIVGPNAGTQGGNACSRSSITSSFRPHRSSPSLRWGRAATALRAWA